jgi:hypothetical protein
MRHELSSDDKTGFRSRATRYLLLAWAFGCALVLERGFHHVVVNTAPNQAFDNVGIHGEVEVSLALD